MALWTADSATVTADAANFTADGGTPATPPSGPATFTGAQFAQAAHTYGQLNEFQTPQFIAQPPPVRARSLSWLTVCRLAGREPIAWYPTYVFGAGQIDRVFSEQV